MAKVVSLGEALIDFIPIEKGISQDLVSGFRKRFGGAPANVAIGLSKLGNEVGFIGKVGDDSFGKFLEKRFKEKDVEVDCLYKTGEVHTTIAFVTLSERGERDFIFYRNPGADELLKPSEIKERYLEEADLLHFGSLSLTGEESKKATYKAVATAREHGTLVSMDPNIRLSLWNNEGTLRKTISNLLEKINLLKLSREEATFLTRTGDVEEAANELLSLGPELVVITLGEKGCYAKCENMDLRVGAYNVSVKDTTGAGDGFTAGFLSKILKDSRNLRDLKRKNLTEALEFGNAAGALTITDYGAISSLPKIDEIEKLREGNN